jgi:glucose/mannose transport system substrate-binding protein
MRAMIGRKRARARRAFGSLALVACSACGGVETEPRTDGTLELISWWSGAGEEAALNSILDEYTARHSRTQLVRPRLTSRMDAQNSIDMSMVSGSPRDTYQTVGGADLKRWVSSLQSEGLQPVDSIARDSGLLSRIPGVVRTALTDRGNLYAIPLDVPRLNVLFYNAQVLRGNSLNPPTTLAEFYAVADALTARGIVPLAISSRDGSVVSQLFFDAVLVTESLLPYRETFLEGDADPSDARVATAVDELGKILSYTNASRDSIEWREAARMVIEGEAAMTFTGDWAKAFLTSAATFRAGEELGQVAFPGSQNAFVFLVDAFTFPVAAPHPQAATNFLKLIASQPVAETFIGLKGTMAARVDVNMSVYDVLTRQTLADFHSSTPALGHLAKVTNREFLTELDATMKTFAGNLDATTVVNMLRNRYAQL